jgi:hypothetical protein
MQPTPSSSLFDTWISRPRYPWLNVSVVLACLLVPLALAWAEGILSPILKTTYWRSMLIPPTIIAYILAGAPRLATMDARVIEALRPLMADDKADLNHVTLAAGAVEPRIEVAVFCSGVAFALALNWGSLLGRLTWMDTVMLFESALMYGLMAMVIYGSIHSTRVTGALLRQNLMVDPLNVTPFEAIGRQSLVNSLMFVGGITLSLLLTWVDSVVLLQWQFWAVYVPLASVPVFIFFLNMAPTHRLLQAARDAELRSVDGLIRQTYASLMRELERGESAVDTAQRVNALTAYETRLREARTWPYNTAMLRTVFVSILVPGGTVVGRLVLEALNR